MLSSYISGSAELSTLHIMTFGLQQPISIAEISTQPFVSFIHCQQCIVEVFFQNVKFHLFSDLLFEFYNNNIYYKK